MRASLVEKVSDVSSIIEELRKASGDIGAICIFLGIVRGTSRGERVLRLEYEAHRDLAPRVLLGLLEEARTKHGIIDGLIEHRIGSAGPGEVVMCVAVASEHREEGFRALMELVDAIKEKAPIWKKELTERRAYWTGGGIRAKIRLRPSGPVKAIVEEDMTAGELLRRLGLEEAEVLREGRPLGPDDLVRVGEEILIRPLGRG